MRKQDFLHLLRDTDEETSVQIGEMYPGIPESDRERIFIRIEHQLQKPIQEECLVIRQVPHVSWRPFAAAAACLVFLGGLSIGLGVLQYRMQPPAESSDSTEATDATNAVSHTSAPVYGIGERYAVSNLTESGTLWLTVEKAGFLEEEPGIYIVSLTLESENAVSAAAALTGQPDVFLADNFMLGTSQQSGLWQTVQPCSISPAGSVYPYAITLAPGDTCTITLQYRLDDAPESLSFVTGYYTASAHTVLTTKED